MSFEATALAGKLTEEQLDAVVATFVHTSDVGVIARKLDLPRALVLEALEDGTLAQRALRAKRAASTVRFLGLSIDRLLQRLESTSKADAKELVAVVKLLRDLLGLRLVTEANREAERAAREARPPKEKPPPPPPKPPKPEKPPKEPKPPREPKVKELPPPNPLEEALRQLSDEDD